MSMRVKTIDFMVMTAMILEFRCVMVLTGASFNPML